MQSLNRLAGKSAAQHQTMFLEKHIAATTVPANRKAILQVVMCCAAFALVLLNTGMNAGR